ncbi:hypothetical protein DL93DRAFT_2082416 [Clavulina sp. PMI_390]|nr:hypothetical protein DL93DRAFT_2082416 [Clavulina sp. PMI_390]
MKPSVRWAWPVWGGLCMILAIFPIVFIVALFLAPCNIRHQNRAEARQQRREELLRSNRVMQGLPLVVDLPTPPPPAALVATNDRPKQGDLEAQTWATDTVAALENQTGMTHGSEEAEPNEPVPGNHPEPVAVNPEPEVVEKTAESRRVITL